MPQPVTLESDRSAHVGTALQSTNVVMALASSDVSGSERMRSIITAASERVIGEALAKHVLPVSSV